MAIAGVLKLVLRNWQVGLLLIGLAGTLLSNIRLQARVRALTKAE